MPYGMDKQLDRRLWAIRRIEQGEAVGAEKLITRFRVTKRTAYRDLEYIERRVIGTIRRPGPGSFEVYVPHSRRPGGRVALTNFEV